MSYSVVTVANSLLELARENRETLTPLKLQKLIYLAQGVALAISEGKEPLFSERIEAWQYGPVVPSLYDRIKKYGSGIITQNIDLPMADSFTTPQVIPRSDTRSWEILEATWGAYGTLSATQLVALTHRETVPEGYPWYEAWELRDGQNRPGTDISDETMATKFSEVVTA